VGYPRDPARKIFSAVNPIKGRILEHPLLREMVEEMELRSD
jgi:hypothetical protein